MSTPRKASGVASATATCSPRKVTLRPAAEAASGTSLRTGKLRPRRNNKRNTYFYSCDRYPECKTIRPRPTGATHAECGATIGKDDEGGICTRCGARVDLPEGELVGLVIAGGTADPLAFAPKRGRRVAADGKAKATGNKAKVASRARTVKSKGKPKRIPAAAAVAAAAVAAAEPSASDAAGAEDEAT